LKWRYPEALYLDLLESGVLRELEARPEKLIQIVDAHPDRRMVIIDEIQRAPEVLSVVHKLIEDRPELTFVLTGSSARKLKRTGVDLLAGRAIKKTMHPFMASELGPAFDFDRALKQGLVPVVTASSEPDAVLKTYIDIYLTEEVKLEGMVRRVGDFVRFLQAAALTHGEILNITNVAADCQVKRKTVETYFGIVEDLLIALRLPVFTRRAQRALVSHPKFYFFDSGVYRSLRPAGPLDTPDEITGPALEGLVLQHIRAWIEYGGHNVRVYYWRSRTGMEVDFVMYGESVFIAMEVKATSRVKSHHLRGIKSFMKDYPQCTPILLYCGHERLRIDDIYCISCEEFLRAVVPGQSLPLPGTAEKADRGRN
jgi:predicted AAA+ superfamily ATPase